MNCYVGNNVKWRKNTAGVVKIVYGELRFNDADEVVKDASYNFALQLRYYGIFTNMVDMDNEGPVLFWKLTTDQLRSAVKEGVAVTSIMCGLNEKTVTDAFFRASSEDRRSSLWTPKKKEEISGYDAASVVIPSVKDISSNKNGEEYKKVLENIKYVEASPYIPPVIEKVEQTALQLDVATPDASVAAEEEVAAPEPSIIAVVEIPVSSSSIDKVIDDYERLGHISSSVASGMKIDIAKVFFEYHKGKAELYKSKV